MAGGGILRAISPFVKRVGRALRKGISSQKEAKTIETGVTGAKSKKSEPKKEEPKEEYPEMLVKKRKTAAMDDKNKRALKKQRTAKTGADSKPQDVPLPRHSGRFAEKPKAKPPTNRGKVAQKPLPKRQVVEEKEAPPPKARNVRQGQADVAEEKKSIASSVGKKSISSPAGKKPMTSPARSGATRETQRNKKRPPPARQSIAEAMPPPVPAKARASAGSVPSPAKGGKGPSAATRSGGKRKPMAAEIDDEDYDESDEEGSRDKAAGPNVGRSSVEGGERRKNVPFEEEECEGLKKAYAELGPAWAKMLRDERFRPFFHPSRTGVDLKDKWRNMNSLKPKRPRKSKHDEKHSIHFRVKKDGFNGRVRWTDEEVESLKFGVKEFGEGHWTEILQKCRFNHGRTTTDIKDKWRNMKAKQEQREANQVKQQAPRAAVNQGVMHEGGIQRGKRKSVPQEQEADKPSKRTKKPSQANGG